MNQLIRLLIWLQDDLEIDLTSTVTENVILCSSVVGEGDLKNCQNFAHVIYGCPQQLRKKISLTKSFNSTEVDEIVSFH